MENSTANKSINLLDLIKYILFYWKWIVLSVVLFVGIFYYRYGTSDLIYRQTETVMLKTASNTRGTSITRTGAAINTVNISNEMLELKSKDLMRLTIERSKSFISYTYKSGLRYEELFTNSPILIELDSSYNNKTFSFDIELLGKNKAELSNFNNNPESKSLIVELNTYLNTSVGKFKIKTQVGKNIVSNIDKIRVKKNSIESVIGYFLGNLTVTQLDGNAFLLNLSMDDNSPLRAATMLGNLVDIYNERTIQAKNEVVLGTYKLIEDRLSVIEDELGGVEKELLDIRIGNAGLSIQEVGGKYISDFRKYESQFEETQSTLRLLSVLKGYLNSSINDQSLIPVNTGLVGGGVESMIIDYNATMLKMNKLTDGDNALMNPVVIDLQNVLESKRNEILLAVDGLESGLRKKMQLSKLDESVARGKSVNLLPTEKNVLAIERQQKIKENLYNYLLNKREENALNQAMTDDNLRIIDKATGKSEPIAPNKLKSLFIGFLIGLILPIIVLIIRLLFDTKVRNRADLLKGITVPYLGDIPQVKSLSKDQSIPIQVSATGRDPLSEAFRILRTNISFMSYDDKPPKVISFTSAHVGAGKTFNVINLVATLSYLKKSVVVVDLDLRKGTFSNRSKISVDTGVTHYLANEEVQIEDIIYKSNTMYNVDVIPIGIVAPNPVELLVSKRLDELFAKLRETYDFVIVDSVPVEIIADAYIIDRVTDLTIFVVRSGKLDKRQLPEIESIYVDKKIKNMAVLLNGVNRNAKGYGYGYGYGYSYGYTYGYAVDKKPGFFARIKSLF